jgi:membrane-associated phospholipid phosphatase
MKVVDAVPLLSIAMFLIVATAGGWFYGFTFAAFAIRTVLLCALGLWTAGLILRRLTPKTHTTARVAESLALIVINSLLASITSAVLAASSSPLIDNQLQHLDEIIFSVAPWPDYIAFLKQHSWLQHCMSSIYLSMNWQPLLLLLLVFVLDRADVARKFTAAWALCLTLCIFPLYFFAADGPYRHYDIFNGPKFGMLVSLPFDFPKVLHAIRDTRNLMITEGTISGLVSMPSFHACSATILAWSFSTWNITRWPMIFLNIAMAISAIAIGGHYYVDIIAGCVVGLVVIAIVDFLASLEGVHPRVTERVIFQLPLPGHLKAA